MRSSLQAFNSNGFWKKVSYVELSKRGLNRVSTRTLEGSGAALMQAHAWCIAIRKLDPSCLKSCFHLKTSFR